ncbi:30S ribosomal protein S12 methylthiotransferase RimO [Saccharicrinis fermentans]|uniref:Ribosomal protein uS12 methylthiotransferase RimO n=1 Tax=Saccharicrinis fermentans DSM 9555 = JCM 21142 TaxID=869213 RepID=W7Y3S3_9BACT|nr:30S ribosomal protein S12 methylthiotransferase RimO [Saccharicrinis fermentans]GAF02677.1 ribosomal protein S12 methylthiotransferase RimO [Saccharicrinis fermentans DSM 9555 = JCM 21142]
MKKIDVVTLGCSKNLVDSESLIKQFEAGGFSVAHDSPSPKGDIAIINTCGFIGDAKEESIETILNFVEAKKRGKVKKLFVMGCLSERYSQQLKEELPEVDAIYGKFDWKQIVEDLGQTYRADLINERSLTTPGHYAYFKISEGCNRSCSYCAIPLITGKHRSKPMEQLIQEAEGLAAQGVKELQVIAQDLSFYGLDIYKQMRLAELVHQVADVDGIDWVRLHYAYPAGFPYNLLKVMNEHPNVCNYLDIALQHVSDHMLQIMRRNVSKAETYKLIERMRKDVPGIHLRTTMITGHPGETEQDFKEMLAFVKEMRFERLGVFPYSHEEDTHAYRNYKDDVPQELKQERADAIMEAQEQISREINEAKVGNTMKVIIDRKEDDYYVGRTEFDSPEVDPEVLIPIEGNKAEVGTFYKVKITGAESYDLFGELSKD